MKFGGVWLSVTVLCTLNPNYFLQVLADIEIAQSLKAESEKAKGEMVDTVPHPIDQNFQSLKCKLTLVDKKCKEYKVSIKLIIF